MADGFTLTQATYSPQEFAALYRQYVGPVSYATVLSWIELGKNTGGQQGIVAGETLTHRYRISAAEVERVLLKAGAHPRG